MTSITSSSLTLVASSLDHPHARTLADQLDGELAGIYGGPTTGRDTALPADLAPPHGLFLIGYLDDVAVACGGVRLRWDEIGRIALGRLPQVNSRLCLASLGRLADELRGRK